MEPPYYVTEIVLRIEQPAKPVDDKIEADKAEHATAVQAARKAGGREPPEKYFKSAEDQLIEEHIGGLSGLKEAMAEAGIVLAEPKATCVRVDPPPGPAKEVDVQNPGPAQ